MSSDFQQKPLRGSIALPILIIATGVGWLLTTLGYGAGVNWLWTVGLCCSGILVFVMSGGVDKVSVVAGPFFFISSGLSILRQTGQIKLETEAPIMVIIIGVLCLVAQLPVIPVPQWVPRELHPPKP